VSGDQHHISFIRDTDRTRLIITFPVIAFPDDNGKGYAQREAFKLAPQDFRYAAYRRHTAGERIRIPADGDDYEG
jgi:hypothetical protein